MALRKDPITGLGARALRIAARFVPQSALLPLTRPSAVFFHGVETTLDDPGLQRNHHQRETFIAIARTLKKRFDVLPLAALDDVLKKPERHSRALFLMSDDGYANAEDAADILEEIGLPWTLFVSTQHIGATERNPMFRARAFLRYARIGDYVLPHIGRVDFLSRPRDSEEKRVIAQLKTLPAERARETLAAMDEHLAEAGLSDLAALFPSDGFLSWAQLKALGRRGVTIGAHAHWHWPMNARQNHNYLVEQALLPKRLIEAEIGPCTAFAYPFGNVEDVSRAAWHAVRDAGYAYAFTTLSASLDASGNRYLLPRYGLGTRQTNLASTISTLRAGNRRLQRWQNGLR
jgi:peptidoglycan/xylan/chitin deacetylase (PgdA/CDA1 family)